MEISKPTGKKFLNRLRNNSANILLQFFVVVLWFYKFVFTTCLEMKIIEKFLCYNTLLYQLISCYFVNSGKLWTSFQRKMVGVVKKRILVSSFSKSNLMLNLQNRKRSNLALSMKKQKKLRKMIKPEETPAPAPSPEVPEGVEDVVMVGEGENVSFFTIYFFS